MGGEVLTAKRRDPRPAERQRAGATAPGPDHRRLAAIGALANRGAVAARLAALRGGAVPPGAGVVQRVRIEELSDEEAARTPTDRTPDRVEAPTEGPRPDREPDEGIRAQAEAMRQRYVAFNEENRRTLEMVGAGLLLLSIIWQTWRAHRGTRPPARGDTAADMVEAQIRAPFEAVVGLREPAKELKDLRAPFEAVARPHGSADELRQMGRHPGWEGMKMGANPLPMPAATRYASFRSFMLTVYRATFVLLGTRRMMEEQVDRVARYARRNGLVGQGQAGQGQAGQAQGQAGVVPQPDLAAVARARNRFRRGFLGGVVGSSVLAGATNLFAHPLFYLQVPWDTVQMMNRLALDAERRRAAMERDARRVQTFNERTMAVRGRAMWNPAVWAKEGIKLLRKL